MREVPLPERGDLDPHVGPIADDRPGAGSRFVCADFVATEDQPVDRQITIAPEDLHQEAARADLDVVGMRADGQDSEGTGAPQGQADHAGLFPSSPAARSCQTAHGMSPEATWASRFCQSRTVSIGAQNPS